jgi:SNF2 family DNA or RNA helicase
VDWVRKGTLGTRSHFASQYETPILAGLNADSSTQQIASQVQRSKELFRSIASFIQRRDVSILTRDLPPFQTAVITLRPSKLQSLLYRKFDKWFKSSGEKMSFISHYQMLRPLHNHPYCLLQQARMSFQKRSDELADSMEGSETIDSDTAVKKESPKIQTRGGKDEKGSSLIQLLDCDDKEPSSGRSSHIENQEEPGRISSLESKENDTNPKLDSESKRGRKIMDYSWVEELSETMDDSEITSAKNGYKLYILLQILAHSQSLGDKVVVFSQCLKSLDFIEQVLMSKDWGRYCQGFEKCEDLGGWRKGVEYLRIDGGTKSSERGDLVAKFDEKLEANKLFLISIEAGGLG